MRATHLNRPVLVHICKDGTVTYRRRHEKVFNGVALPVFSVDTEADAQALQTRFCKVQYKSHPLMPGKTWYRLTDFAGELEDLPRVTDMFARYYDKMKGKADA